MTPQERQLIDDLFDRLAKVESVPRDSEAMSAIMQGLRNAPNAIYPLVQTVLLQDEALRRAGERIQQLEQGQAQDQGQAGGFLDSMRDKISGQSNQARGSVPNVPPPVPESRPVWNSGQVLQQTQNPNQGQGQYDQGYGQGYGQGNYQGNYQGGYGGPGYGQGPYGGPQSPFGGGGSFLGTAAATAAGVIGGSLLMNSIRGMMGGGHHQQAFGDSTLAGSPSPWSGDQSGSSAARDLGVNDVGRASNHADDSGRRAGLFDTASNDSNDRDDMDMDSDDFGGDNDSDYA
jgi:hypothetical protein